MPEYATFRGPNGSDPGIAIRQTAAALSTVTTGDLMYVGEIYRSRIRERTFAGIDVNGAPFTPYSTKGPFYFSPNKSATSNRKARATAAEGRHQKTGRIGIRTTTGIRYESYAAAKSAHGVSNVNLFGMEQHPHMLDGIIVKAGGATSNAATGALAGMDFGSSFAGPAFEQNQPCTSLTLGFYGEEAERARGHNEGTAKLPQRNFFALNGEDLKLGEKAIVERMTIRARQQK